MVRMVKDRPPSRSFKNILLLIMYILAQGTAQWCGKKLFLGTANKQSCLRYAKAYHKCPANKWNQDWVIWSQPEVLCMAEKQHSVPGEEPVKCGGGSIMLWAFVASKGTGILVRVEGRMYSTQYHQILKNNVQESVKRLKLCRSWLFQQDNDTEYCSKSTKS